MSTLTIRHLPGTDPPHFELRDSKGKTTTAAAVTPAAGYPVDGLPQSDLMGELRWYLEEFLDYPFPPETEHADRVVDALEGWGRVGW